jgi:hypothetical protein
MKEGFHIFAFDIETRGKSPRKHGILAVGVVIGLDNGVVLFKKQWNVNRLNSKQGLEPRCFEEFWSKQPKEVWNSFRKDLVTPYTFAKEFRALLDVWEKLGDLYLLSDNPTVDAGFINYYLDEFDFDSMQYKSDSRGYRFVHDADSYACGAIRAPLSYNWPSDSDVQKLIGFHVDTSDLVAHNPVDDATKIFRQFVALVGRVADKNEEFYAKIKAN